MPASTSARRRSRVASASISARLVCEQPPEHERQDAAVPQILALARRVEPQTRPELLLVRAHRHLTDLCVLEARDRELLPAGEAERLRAVAVHELKRQHA